MTVIRQLPVTIESVEKQLLRFRYKPLIPSAGVDKVQMPSITLPFWYFVFHYGRIPSEMELAKFYVDVYRDNLIGIVSRLITHIPDHVIYQRVYRAYPSLIRDLHFYLMCHESGLFTSVRWDLRKDMDEGIDISVRNEEEWYHLRLFVDNKNSRSWASLKEKKDVSLTKYLDVTIQLTPDNSKVVGDFFLYTEDHMRSVYEAIVKTKKLAND